MADLEQLFPEDFLWGASTSGHQVEGGNYDQWTIWELAHAKELAAGSEKRLSNLPDWPAIKAEASQPDNYISGKGVDHYHKYREDFAIVRKLNLNSLRFTVEWSRLEPEAGVWDEREVDHYHNYIAELKKQGIEPVLTLWHWTHPAWFEDRGGFGRKENLSFWMRFVQKVADEFGSEVRYILTVNEPNIYVVYREFNGNVHVPPQAPLPQRLLMFWRLIKAHKLAYRVLKRTNPALQISAAVQIGNNEVKPRKFTGKLAAWGVNKLNYFFYDRTRRYNDFIGFNYYFTVYFDGFKTKQPAKPLSDLGWYMEPGGVGEVATKLWLRYHKPVMVTENGLADDADEQRQWWLKETMIALVKAQNAGVKLIGYMHWSLLDNFEWSYGWWPHFGLVKVDREGGMKRIVRPSAVWWSKQLAAVQGRSKSSK